MNQPTPDQVEQIFTHLMRGQYQQFLSRCEDDLVLIARDSSPVANQIQKATSPVGSRQIDRSQDRPLPLRLRSYERPAPQAS
jgi:hypothetical protein